ncbi:hypothetical protein PRIPAC_83514 [Pristionchus pacificus]|uniref:Protein kinase domain-containing protein n=1 Tax=Pristionchus pacificus TaxID=54126 RepID=A0A2A6BLV9_PRIPA|nr:hypothetical protein PRIPAC_83514 [Pristionchus pacificus]|eukprot:PDM66895.1 protein kinase [Pristionchus pacificus]
MREWFEQIVSAVDFHEKEIMHRDLKPGNILIDYEHKLKICDFGIVAEFSNDQTQPVWRTDQLGTALYMAPEQYGKFYDWRVDICSLGLIFAEMCVPINEGDLSKTFGCFRSGMSADCLTDIPDD